MTVAAILLAAGASKRMGSPKPLIPWGDQTLIEWEIDQLMASCVDEIVVVLGSHAEEVRRAMGDGARYCVFNQRWHHGRSTSLVKGASALVSEERLNPEATVIQNVDQPTRSDIIDRLVDELIRARVDAVQPSFEGHGGHPVVIAGHVLPLLRSVEERTLGLRHVLEQHPPLRVPMDDEPIVALDLDTPEELPKARVLLGIPEPL